VSTRTIRIVTTQIHAEALPGQPEHEPDANCWCKPVVTTFRNFGVITTIIDHWGAPRVAVSKPLLVDLLPPSSTRPMRFVPTRKD